MTARGTVRADADERAQERERLGVGHLHADFFQEALDEIHLGVAGVGLVAAEMVGRWNANGLLRLLRLSDTAASTP